MGTRVVRGKGGRNRRGRPDGALFEPCDVEFGEPFGHADRSPRVPHEPGIDHDIVLRADRAPYFTDKRHIVIGVLPQRLPSEFHRGEPAVHIFPRHAAGLLDRIAEKRTGVCPHLIPPACAEKPPDRHARSLAHDVPEGEIDAAHGLNGGPPPAVIDGPLVHLLPDAMDLEWVLSKDDLPEPPGEGMRSPRLNDGLDDPWRGIHLPNTFDTLVRGHPHHRGILAAVGTLHDLREREYHDFHIGDLHGTPLA